MASTSPEFVSSAQVDAEEGALEPASKAETLPQQQQPANDPLLDARQAADEHTAAVYKLVLTGGPCAGKTTALSRMGSFFRAKGFRVFTVPEAATSMFSNGIGFQDLGSQEKRFAFQWGILSLQMTLEDGFERFARTCGQPSILLCDRGLMDGSVYMPPEEWASLVQANGMDERSLRDGRYDGILHLVTAACGAEEHYSLENNEVRSESVEVARDVDAKTEAVWLGHPRHLVFDNSTGFEAKLLRLTTAASRLVGLPCRPRKLCKFLLYEPPPPVEEFPVPTKEFRAEKVHLVRREAEIGQGGLMTALPAGDDKGEEDGAGDAPAAPVVRVSSESFLEKRGRDELSVYSLTTLSSYSDGTVTELTKQLSAAQHEAIKRERADTARPKVVQRRVSFLWERQAFELHTDLEPAHGINVLHRRSEGGELSLPTFLKVDELGAHAHHSVRASHQRLYRRARSTGDRSSNDVVSPTGTSKTAGGAGLVEQDSHQDEWDTWEFGTWKTRTHEENMAEAAAREAGPASVSTLMGKRGLVDQPTSDLDRAINLLKGYLSEDRLSRMQDVLDERTRSATLVFENPANPNNVWACLRTLDSFGVQHAHVVSDPTTYSKKARLKTMCAAMGSQKWLTLHGHDSPEDAVANLKADGYQVVASDLSPSAVPIGEIDWSVPTAVVLGNEERGISDSMRNMADATFVIPMRGFVRSFNMSVACSIILAHLSAVRALKHGDLPEDERRRVQVTWLMQCVRGSEHVLRREGIDIPQEIFGTDKERPQNIAGFRVR
eukprot:g14650.t1